MRLSPFLFLASLGLALALLTGRIQVKEEPPVLSPSLFGSVQPAVAAQSPAQPPAHSSLFGQPQPQTAPSLFSAAAPSPLQPQTPPPAQSAFQPPQMPAASGGFRLEEITYPVYGSTVQEIVQTFQVTDADQPGRKFAAMVRWQTYWNFHPQQQGDRCAPVNPAISVTATRTMPEWSGMASDMLLEARWRAFRSALETHEDGHIEHARSAYREASQILPSLIAPTCADLIRIAGEQVMTINGKWDAITNEYDRTTQHGATQGARLGLAVGVGRN